MNEAFGRIALLTRRDETNGLDALLEDIIDSGLPDPELLARHSAAPNELSTEERERIEGAVRRSRAVVDELDTLRGFDFGQFSVESRAEGAIARTRLWLTGFLAQPRTWVGAAAAAAVAIALWVAQPEGPVGEFIEQGAEGRKSPSLASETTASDRAGKRVSPGPVQEQHPAPEAGQEARYAESSVPRVHEPVPPPATDRESGPKPSGPERAGVRRQPANDGTVLLAMLEPEYVMPPGAASRDREEIRYRDPGSPAPEIRALAPAHVARTALARPTLTWSIDRLPDTGGFYLSVMGADDEALIENLRLPDPRSKGIQSTSLESLDVEMTSGREYRWSIAHRIDPESPPTRYAVGWIERVEMSAALEAEIEDASGGNRPALLARSGYWYDALAQTIELARSHPGDDRPKSAVRSLLKSAGIAGSVPID